MPKGTCPICSIGECGPVMGVNRMSPNLGPRVCIVDNEGKLLARFGDVYVGEDSATAWPQLKPDEPAPQPLHSLRKMTRLPAGQAP